MKIDELISRVGADKVGIQRLDECLINATQKRGHVAATFGTDCVSMRDVATGKWENVVFVVSMKRSDYDAAIDALAQNGGAE